MGLATREAYGKALVELGAENKDIVVLDADLSKSTKTADFKKAYPERFINAGIAEQNLLGMSAGLARYGKIPFASTFAVFASGRAFEIIRNSVCYPNANVKIAATHAGITVGEDGGSHQSIEDIAIMNSLPNMSVLVPADAKETNEIIKYAAKHNGPVYIRLGRLNSEDIFGDDYKFEYGKGVCVKEGKDCTIIATGLMTAMAKSACETLKEEGIDVRLIHMPTIKPIDREIIECAAKETDFILTCEEHSVVGGLGQIVASVTSETVPTKVIKLGVNDVFGESATPKELLEKHGLTSENIVRLIKENYKK
ncbi:transketolase family protein [Romboutsia lituseburensis]|uniref:Transketolase subunit B n=1 Tax=Romboutsia lituseburensis DSM 797 TaxID=1121325 RepID=A0A1G9NPW2_9FIRM|nr:transketolase family protein [Romboutsia lituseburensis]CEH33047.1 Transketolase [Romboutsia lituseburensis]SDL88067.1 transketolase subunit B [Romboutsia lituseburensis DSM 797]